MDYSCKCFFCQECFKTVDVHKMVVGSSAYWCDMFKHVKNWPQITPIFVTDPLGVMNMHPFCYAGVFRDLQNNVVMPNIWYLFYYHLVLESSMAEYQQYIVLNISRKGRNLTHCQDLMIYTAVCHQYISDINYNSLYNDPTMTDIHCENWRTKNWTLW